MATVTYPKILVVDDHEPILKLFDVNLSVEGFEVLTAQDGLAALEILEAMKPELVILDIMMPGKTGVDLLPEMKKKCPDTQVIMATASADVHTAIKCMKTGAFDYITKPFKLADVYSIVRRAMEERSQVIENRNHEQDLLARVKLQAKKLDASYLNGIKALAKALEAKDRYTKGHSLRVAGISVAIAEQLGLSRKAVQKVRIAGLVHDIGKIGVSESILNKPAGLTAEEFNHVKTHCEIGAKILAPLGGDEEIIKMVRNHHESYDGNGYPDKLRAEEIPLGARILAVADSYDAMTSERPYRRPMIAEAALAEIQRCRGIQFDVAVADAFLKIQDKQRELMHCSAS